MNIFKISENPARNKIVWVVIAMIMVIGGYALYLRHFVINKMGLETFFHDLEKSGYTANRQLSGLYYPGNVIQVMEKKEPDGKVHSLNPPLVFLWHTDCFPNKIPNEKRYGPLGILQGKKTGSIQLKSGPVSELLPMLDLDSNVEAQYSLVLQNQRLLTYSKAELNRQFSDKCYENLSKAVNEEGDHEDWFAVIYEAVVADSLELEVNWKTAASAKSRATVTTEAEKKLADITRNITPRSGIFDVFVALESENEKKTVVHAKGLVILGYRTRRLEVR